MAASTLTERNPYSREIPASRVPRSLHASLNQERRRKSGSAVWDGRYWGNDEVAGSSRTQRINLRQSLAAAILPQAVAPTPRLAVPVLADFCTVVMAFAVVASCSRWLGPAFVRPGLSPWSLLSSGWALLFLYGSVLTLLGYSEGLYHSTVVQEQSVVLGKIVAWSTILGSAAIGFLSGAISAVAEVTAAAPLTYFAMLAWRYWRRHTTLRQVCSGRVRRGVLIVGAGPLGNQVAEFLESEHTANRVVLGFVDDTAPLGSQVIGRLRDLARVARAEFVDEVIVTLPPASAAALQAIEEARRNRLDVKLVPDMLGLESCLKGDESFGPLPVLTLHRESPPALGLFLKRVFDAAASFVLLVIAAPAMAVIAALIKLDSSGPAFYQAPRAGRKGKCFDCYKFRTMFTGAHQLKESLRPQNERSGATFKLAHDPRITRIGGFLRRYSLDELPQLWNVLAGDMSLVGPRPHTLEDCRRYQLEDLRRLDVMPGITGLWQVTARRDPSFETNVHLDVEYIERWSLWLDLKILLKTAAVVLQGSGV